MIPDLASPNRGAERYAAFARLSVSRVPTPDGLVPPSIAIDRYGRDAIDAQTLMERDDCTLDDAVLVIRNSAAWCWYWAKHWPERRELFVETATRQERLLRRLGPLPGDA